MLTQVLAQELIEHNISVNEIIPGPVLTDLSQTDRSIAPESTPFSIKGEWIKQPEDVVDLALFLACQPSMGPTAQSFSLMRRPK
jgi:3-oxoacyl-[acyl-carrier protein] reductase